MRTFHLRVETAMPPSRLWALRQDAAMDAKVALKAGRVLRVVRERALPDGDGQVEREVEVTFQNDPVPPFLRSRMKTAPTSCTIRSRFYPTRCDADHAMTTTTASLEGRVVVNTKQWIDHCEVGGSVAHTEVCVHCDVVGIGGVVERLIEKNVRQGAATHFARLEEAAAEVEAAAAAEVEAAAEDDAKRLLEGGGPVTSPAVSITGTKRRLRAVAWAWSCPWRCPWRTQRLRRTAHARARTAVDDGDSEVLVELPPAAYEYDAGEIVE